MPRWNELILSRKNSDRKSLILEEKRGESRTQIHIKNQYSIIASKGCPEISISMKKKNAYTLVIFTGLPLLKRDFRIFTHFLIVLS